MSAYGKGTTKYVHIPARRETPLEKYLRLHPRIVVLTSYQLKNATIISKNGKAV